MLYSISTLKLPFGGTYQTTPPCLACTKWPHRERIFSWKLEKNKMTRSLKKGPYVDPRVLKKIEGKKPGEGGVIKTWSRACQISPEMVGFTFGVHNGMKHIEVLVSEDMVGHRLGEFAPTKTFYRHGGKIQKELEQKQRDAEIAAAKAAKAATETK